MASEGGMDKQGDVAGAERWLARVAYADSRQHSSVAIAELMAAFAAEATAALRSELADHKLFNDSYERGQHYKLWMTERKARESAEKELEKQKHKLERRPVVYEGAYLGSGRCPDECPECDSREFVSAGKDMVCYRCHLLSELGKTEAEVVRLREQVATGQDVLDHAAELYAELAEREGSQSDRSAAADLIKLRDRLAALASAPAEDQPAAVTPSAPPSVVWDAARIRQLLTDNQWGGIAKAWPGPTDTPGCPACYAPQIGGKHDRGCWISEALGLLDEWERGQERDGGNKEMKSDSNWRLRHWDLYERKDNEYYATAHCRNCSHKQSLLVIKGTPAKSIDDVRCDICGCTCYVTA